MASRASKRRRQTGPRLQHPGRRPSAPGRQRRWALVAAALGVGAVVALAVVLQSGGSQRAARSGGLPQTSDYHSLLVAPADPEELLLGTHQGLYRSRDGGRSWSHETLSGDAMNLARPSADTLWAAGHELLAKSVDGGETWVDVRPSGLPGLDIHGFAVDPRDPRTLFAAVAGRGLYRSRDGGRSFAPVSSDVGPGAMALAVTPDGRILAGEMQQGLMMSADDGRSWSRELPAGVMGLAVNPKVPKRVLATGPGVFLTEDGGRTWIQVLELEDGAGPVAWSSSDARLAYAVGFDRVLYRSGDGGRTWNPVG